MFKCLNVCLSVKDINYYYNNVDDLSDFNHLSHSPLKKKKVKVHTARFLLIILLFEGSIQTLNV